MKSRRIIAWNMSFCADEPAYIRLDFSNGSSKTLKSKQRDKGGKSIHECVCDFYKEGFSSPWYFHEDSTGWWIDQEESRMRRCPLCGSHCVSLSSHKWYGYKCETCSCLWTDEGGKIVMEPVDFWTALEAAAKDENVVIEPVTVILCDRHYYVRGGLLYTNSAGTALANLSLDRYLQTKWHIKKVEPKLHTGVEAIEAFRRGQQIKRKERNLWTSKMTVPHVSADDFLHDDWLIKD